MTPSEFQRPVGRPARIVIVGGGAVGFGVARILQRRLPSREATVTVVDPQPAMTYQPFLAEVAAGSIEARHVVVPLRAALRRCEVLTGAVTAVDPARRLVDVRPASGPSYALPYDVLILAAGSIARSAPVPGLTEHGIALRTVADALFLRNHVLARLDLAATTDDPEVRRRALAFVVVGGGYSGVELVAELEDLARFVVRRNHPTIDPAELRWVLVEAADRILPQLHPKLAAYVVRRLARRGVDVRLATTISSVAAGRVVLSDGSALATDTVAWTAGVAAHPLAGQLGGEVDDSGRVRCGPDLRVLGAADVWAAGDCANVPDLARGDGPVACAPTAQHAVRQARRLAGNVVQHVRGGTTRPYRHRDAGSVASLGLYRGVAEVYGIRVRGLPAWFMHRGYHLKALPTWNRRLRVLADWVLALVLRRDVAALDYALIPIGAVSIGAVPAPPAEAGIPPRGGSAEQPMTEVSAS